MEVKLGKPMLRGVADVWVAPSAPAPGMPGSGQHELDWLDVEVAVELQPWPNHEWLLFWREAEWPKRPQTRIRLFGEFDEPVLDWRRRRLIFTARPEELEDAWNAVKIRVESANTMYRGDREQGSFDDDRWHHAELHAVHTQDSPRRHSEALQRRIDELE